MANGALEDVTADELDPNYVARRVEDWIDRINALFDNVEKWLPPGWCAKRGRPIRMDEELMRRYQVGSRDVPVLEIVKSDGSQVILEPRGLWIIGANGRVDLKGSRGPFVVVDTAESLTPPSWHIAPAADRQELQPLDRASFLAAV